MPAPSTPYKDLATLLARLNALAPSYALGGLQALRKEVKGLHRRPAVTPFPSQPNNDAWAFHLGGRRELQFNVGYDKDDAKQPALRYGVAFSFEPGPDLTDPEGTLVPLVAHFNDYVRTHSDQFDDLQVWTYCGGKRSQSRPMGPLHGEEVRRGAFVFIGWLGPRVPTEADLPGLLSNLDRLMPLYEAVLRAEAPPSQAESAAVYKDQIKIVVQLPPRLIDVTLRHRLILDALQEEMVRRYGKASVRREHTTVLGGRIDLRVIEHGARVVYYEVKTAASARGCIREALGQLLEYAHWPGTEPVHELVVASDQPLNAEAAAWMAELGRRYGMPLRYLAVQMLSA